MLRGMTDQTKRKPDDPEQSKRFIDTAKEIGADETPEGAKRVFKNVPQRNVRRQTTHECAN